MTTTAKTATVPGPRAAADYDGHLLEVRDLHVEFHTRDGVAKAVNGVNYTVDAGETLAVLGESGSGKSVTAQAIMGILDMPPGRIPQGEVLFRGQDMLTMGKEERRKIRGQKIAMIFQDALSSLNPVLSVGYQLGEMFRVHQGLSKKEAKAKAIELMERVKIPAAKERVNDYPHQFSGGMRQRIMIAMALALEPDLIIADEPTTALDVTVQAQVMDLLAELQREYNMGLILITHDLGVVADVADKIAVMYAGRIAGRIVETAPVHELYARPAHPYTRGLLDSIPRLDQKGQELYAIKGLPPNLTRIPSGCAFNPRCPMAQDICRTEVPTLAPVTEQDGTDLPGRGSACHFWKETIHG
ncbi:methionine ABC transporter ATP-binding protein [Streptomyces albidoflavus]|uniref:ABC transporter ATP-binding protein n=2 Tax=Streptomyces TaxID=1883 RepID=UPI0007443168|nr:ABC transporter ATP-binding protein [Streptomyces albidoflavus]KUL60233.1 methionine ABC transporter ATP-binding protein [Streptomyces albidoflavus]